MDHWWGLPQSPRCPCLDGCECSWSRGRLIQRFTCHKCYKMMIDYEYKYIHIACTTSTNIYIYILHVLQIYYLWESSQNYSKYGYLTDKAVISIFWCGLPQLKMTPWKAQVVERIAWPQNSLRVPWRHSWHTFWFIFEQKTLQATGILLFFANKVSNTMAYI